MSLPDPTLREYLQPHPDVTVLEWDLTGEPPLPRIDIVVPPYMGGTEVLRSLAAGGHGAGAEPVDRVRRRGGVRCRRAGCSPTPPASTKPPPPNWPLP